MRGKLTFVAGVALGFVLGTRAGRERYDELVRTTKKVLDSPTMQEATGVVQSQASKLYEKSKDTLGNSNITDKISGKLRHPLSGNQTEIDDLLDTDRQHMSPNSF